MKNLTILATIFLAVAMQSGDALAQRRGSVHYSRPSASRARTHTSSATTSNYRNQSTSAPVRYQKPMNMQPVGTRAKTLPPGHRRYAYGGGSYYYSGGNYYADTQATGSASDGPPGYNSGPNWDTGAKAGSAAAPLSGEGRYVIVAPPVGVVVDELPVGTTEEKKGLYKYNNVYYRPAYDEGQVKYVVSLP